MNLETYFLSSLESKTFGVTRECVLQKRLHFNTGKECALVRVNPSVVGQDYGSGTDLDLFVITNRHKGEGLSPIKEFPCLVFIARPLVDDIEMREEISKDDVEIVAWGELYRTRADADHHVFGK